MGKDSWSKLDGVKCSVSTCVHHGEDSFCHASNISVGAEAADSKQDTFCGTFANQFRSGNQRVDDSGFAEFGEMFPDSMLF